MLKKTLKKIRLVELEDEVPSVNCRYRSNLWEEKLATFSFVHELNL
jgi:hypothetical protein